MDVTQVTHPVFPPDTQVTLWGRHLRTIHEPPKGWLGPEQWRNLPCISNGFSTMAPNSKTECCCYSSGYYLMHFLDNYNLKKSTQIMPTLLMDILMLSVRREGDPVYVLHCGFISQGSFLSFSYLMFQMWVSIRFSIYTRSFFGQKHVNFMNLDYVQSSLLTFSLHLQPLQQLLISMFYFWSLNWKILVMIK